MQLVIGRIAKAHGVGGEVAVEVRTDVPEQRFAVGNRVATDPDDRGPLEVRGTRWHAGRLLVRFVEIGDRAAAEALRGTLLVVDSATCAPTDDPDEFWDHDLIGLTATTPAGDQVGEVVDVLHPPGPDVLVLQRPDGTSALVPFVAAIVPAVELAARRLVIDPPDGLLEL